MREFWFVITATLTLVVLFVIWQFKIAIVLFLLSLAIAAALRPLVNNMIGRVVSRQFALGIVYFSVISSILVWILLLASPLSRDLQLATDDLVAGYERIKVEWPRGASMFRQMIGAQLPPAGDLYRALTSQEGEPALEGLFGAAGGFFSTVGSVVIVIILSVYWSADQLRFERLGLSLIRKEQHARALHIWRSIETTAGSFIRSEIVQGILALLFLGLGYWLIGVRYPALFALWGSFVRVIPWFGPLLAVSPLLLGMTGGAGFVNIPGAIYAIGLLTVLKLAVEPRFFLGKKTSSFFMLLTVISMAVLFGLLGAMLAPLFAVAIQALFQELYPSSPYRFSPPILKKTEEIGKRLEAFRNRLPQPFHPETRLLVDRLKDIWDKTRAYVQD